MGKVFDWLDRPSDEDVNAYDKRINSLAAFHAGYAFFVRENYHGQMGAFAVYVVWNGELNAKLESPLPAGGFMMHCDREQAEDFLRFCHAYPVFIRLRAKLGRLYAEHMLLSDREKLFDVYYNGCEVIPPGNTCFRTFVTPEDGAFSETEAMDQNVSVADRSGIRFPGSYANRKMRKGSYYLTSFLRSSYFMGSAAGGSFRFGGYLWGSYFAGSYRFGRLFGLGSGFGAGSFRFGRGSYLSYFGSFGYGSFSFGFAGNGKGGSYTGGSFLTGSFLHRLVNGSYYGGSYHRGSYVYGGCADPISASEEGGYTESIMIPGDDSIIVYRGSIPIRRLIEEMGYGLDLI